MSLIWTRSPSTRDITNQVHIVTQYNFYLIELKH